MYAVLKTGGKQYRVSRNDVLVVERLPGEAGSVISLDDVLMVGNGSECAVGQPQVPGARVVARILEQKRGDKIIVFKKKRRKNYRRTRGHRQELTVLRIADILPDAEAVPREEVREPARPEHGEGPDVAMIEDATDATPTDQVEEHGDRGGADIT